MNQEDEGGITGSFWGRFVPLSVSITGLGMFLQGIPFMNALGMIGVPAALLVLYLEREESPAWRWSPAAVTGLVVIPIVPALGIIGVGMVIVAALLDLGVRSGWDWKMVGLAASGPVLLWVPIGLLFWNVVAEYTRELLETNAAMFIEQMQGLGFSTALMTEVEGSIAPTIEMTIGTLPSQFVLMGLLIGFGALLASQWWLERREEGAGLDLPPFTTWEVSDRFLWAMIAGIALAVIGRAAGDRTTAALIGWNVVIVVSLFYWIQGTAIVWYSFVTRDTPRWIRVLFAIAGATLLIPGLVVLGILEKWIPFRRLMAGLEGSGIEEDE